MNNKPFITQRVPPDKRLDYGSDPMTDAARNRLIIAWKGLLTPAVRIVQGTCSVCGGELEEHINGHEYCSECDTKH